MVNKSIYTTPETALIEVRFEEIILYPVVNKDENTQTFIDDGVEELV